MICWLLALGVRVEMLRLEVDRAQRENQVLHGLANTDPLTGLLNRRGFDEALRTRLREPDSQAIAVFLADLDGFKPVNDRWGHDVGDQLLREVAGRMHQVTGEVGLVARLGGDEFVLACAVHGLDDAKTLGRRLLEQFTAPFILGQDRCCSVGATVGYALAAEHGADATALLRAADEAMYAGKQTGKNRLVRASKESADTQVDSNAATSF